MNEGLNLIAQRHDPFTLSLTTALVVSCFAPGFVVRLKNWRQPVEADCEADYSQTGKPCKRRIQYSTHALGEPMKYRPGTSLASGPPHVRVAEKRPGLGKLRPGLSSPRLPQGYLEATPRLKPLLAAGNLTRTGQNSRDKAPSLPQDAS